MFQTTNQQIHLQVRTQHFDPLMPCWRPSQLVQHPSAMEEEPAVHPEPIDDPGKDAGTGAGSKHGAEQFWRNHEKSGIELAESWRIEPKRRTLA